MSAPLGVGSKEDEGLRAVNHGQKEGAGPPAAPAPRSNPQSEGPVGNRGFIPSGYGGSHRAYQQHPRIEEQRLIKGSESAMLASRNDDQQEGRS